MKYTLYYYSGAGNTERISRMIRNAIAGRGHAVSATRITRDNLSLPNDDFDVAGFGFPIHFRDAPELVYEYLKSLDGRNRSIFFYCTKGLYSGNAMRSIIALSAKRHFIFRGLMEFYMPGTDALLFFARKGSLLERLLKAIHSRRIESRISEFVSSLDEGSDLSPPPAKWYTALDNWIVKPLEIRANNKYRDYVGQFHTMTDRCTECRLCVKACPRSNISASDKGIEFGENCDVCLKCIHRCPAEAIQIGEKTLNTVRWNPEKAWAKGRELGGDVTEQLHPAGHGD